MRWSWLRLSVTLAIAWACLPGALADDGKLAQAKELVEQQDYAAAQQVLLEIDEMKLTAEEREEVNALLGRLPEMIQGALKAEQDLNDADKAYAEAQWGEAERLYTVVTNNQYAKPVLKMAARQQLQRIEEKRELADASAPASPAGPVTTEQMKPTPTEQPNPMVEAPIGTPVTPRRATLLEEMQRRESLLWQRAMARMRDAARNARESASKGNFDDARQYAERALQAVEAARAYAEPAAKYEAARADANALIAEINEAARRAAVSKAQESRSAVAERIRQRREEQERRKRETIEQLFNTARQLVEEQRYSEAAETVKQILLLDPSNEEARYKLSVYDELASRSLQEDIESEYRRMMRDALVQAEQTKIPYYQDVLYPKNWLEITAKRQAAELGLGAASEDAELNRRLAETVPDVTFQQMPLDQVVDYMTDLKNVNITVEWEDLARSGIDRDKPISLQLKNVSYGTLLREVLAQTSSNVAVGFAVRDGLLRIATQERLDQDKYILVYDIRDLLVNIPKFTNAPKFNLGEITQQLRRQTGNDVDNPFREPSAREGARIDGEQDEQAVVYMDMIRDMVKPDSWQSRGGEGALRELNGQLIVYNTSDAHREVADLLNQLRKTRALQIALESRFLTVTSNFLEEIGIDLDFVFNIGNAGYDRAFSPTSGGGITDPFTGANVLVPRQFSRSGTLPGTPPFGTPITQNNVLQPFSNAGFVPGRSGGSGISNATPLPMQQGSLAITDPTGISTGIPGSIAQQAGFSPGLNIAGSYLDNLQVDFLIRATQANRRSSIVQAPRLMMFNGQRAFVAISRTRTYIASVSPVVAEGAVGFQPQPQPLPSGNVLDVEGTISADRRYVAVTIRATFAADPSFERFEVQRASGNSPGLFLLLPDQQAQNINTTVSVPDGGTVLIGGLKQVGEVQVDAGVPILSKIPILKRAFTNTSTVKDAQTLLILLKAKILIQEEAEEEAFPTLDLTGVGA